MEPTTILSNEHRVIEVMLSVLEQLANKALVDKKLEHQSAEEAIDFIRNFADKCHHGKEEAHLFVAMVAKGIPKEGGPIGQMLHEHEQGRAFVRGMVDTLVKADSGDSKVIQEFTSNAFGYVELLRAHIYKEDHILFPLASRILSNEDKIQLIEKFEQVESELMGQANHNKYLGIVKKLADKFNIPRDSIAEFN
jgi:hemerythrin-like domain-containing protein